MKQTVAILFGIILITSCSEVRFSQPQPLNTKELENFPRQYVGQYLSSGGDTLVVTPESFYYAKDEIKYLSSDEVVLKKKKSLYFISCKMFFDESLNINRKGWSVLPFEMINDSIYVYFLDVTNQEACDKTLEILNDIVNVESVLNKDGKVEYYYVDPSIEQFGKMLSSQCFSIAEKFSRINYAVCD